MVEHAEVCPVCQGSGKYKEEKCHGCDGRGWVKVGTDYPYVQWYRHGYEVICQVP